MVSDNKRVQLVKTNIVHKQGLPNTNLPDKRGFCGRESGQFDVVCVC